MKKKIVIYGSGDFALHCAHLFEASEKFDVIAFTVDKRFLLYDTLGNKPVIPFENVCEIYPAKDFEMFVAIGYKNMRARKRLYHNALCKGYNLISYISPNSIIDENVTIGRNNIIMDGVIIERSSKIGHNNIFWSGVIVCHDTIVRDHSFFAARATLGGYSKIKDSCFVGFNSVVLQNITLEKETLVGACSLVLKNSLEYSKLVGQPARLVNSHSETGIELK